MNVYFGFAIADSMFNEQCEVSRFPISVEDVRSWTQSEQLVSILNPSHKPTIDAMRSRFGIDVTIPDKAPIVKLKSGDRVIVMSVRGLPRLENAHEYTAEQIASATFAFGMWRVAE